MIDYGAIVRSPGAHLGALVQDLTRPFLAPSVPTPLPKLPRRILGEARLGDLAEWARTNAPLDRDQAMDILGRYRDTGPMQIAIWALSGYLAEGVLEGIIVDVWKAADGPETAVPRELWIKLADQAGRPGIPGIVAERPYMQSIQLFRGSVAGTGPGPGVTDPATGRGMTWTASRGLASIYGFARGHVGVVYSARVNPRRILFASSGCGRDRCDGSEYVLDTIGLDIQVSAVPDDAVPGSGLWPHRRRSICPCGGPMGESWSTVSRMEDL